MHRRLPLIALALALSALAAGPAHAAGGSCDPTGDRSAGDDCVTHVHIGAAADGRVASGEEIAIRQHLDRALRGSALVTEVQARRIHRGGEKGPWITVRRLRWPAAMTAKGGTRDVAVCVAALAGRYQFRTATRVPRAVAGDRAGRTFADVLATSAPTGVTMPNGGSSTNCASDEDAENVELFNQWEYLGLLEIETAAVVPGTGGADPGTTIALSCPERPSPEIGATLGIGVFLAGQATGAGCNGAGLVLDRATLLAGGYPECTLRNQVPLCRVTVLAWSTVTQVIYSETQLMLPIDGDQTLIPNLLPATIPFCNATLNSCLLSGTCALSTQKTGVLQLCSSPTSCAAPPPPTGMGSFGSAFVEPADNPKFEG